MILLANSKPLFITAIAYFYLKTGCWGPASSCSTAAWSREDRWPRFASSRCRPDRRPRYFSVGWAPLSSSPETSLPFSSCPGWARPRPAAWSWLCSRRISRASWPSSWRPLQACCRGNSFGTSAGCHPRILCQTWERKYKILNSFRRLVHLKADKILPTSYYQLLR